MTTVHHRVSPRQPDIRTSSVHLTRSADHDATRTAQPDSFGGGTDYGQCRTGPVALGWRLATLSSRDRRSSACGQPRRRTRAVSDRSLGWSVRGFGRETTGNATHRAEPRRRRIGSTICRAPPVRFRSARSGRARIPAKSHFSARSERKIETRQRSFPSAVADAPWAVPADRAGRTAKQGADEPYARSDSGPRRCSGWSS